MLQANEVTRESGGHALTVGLRRLQIIATTWGISVLGRSSGRFARNLFACLAVGVAGLALSVADARDTGTRGGETGGNFRSTCNPGNILIGFNMNSGSALDRIVPICIPANPDGTWTGTAYEAPPTGGDGGDYQKIACSVNYAVTHLHVFVDGNNQVNHIIISCKSLTEDAYEDWVPGQIGGRATDDARFGCEAGEFGTGIYGRSGGIIDQLGLQCEKFSFKSAAQSAAEEDGRKARLAQLAEIAEDERVTGKNPAECDASHNRCHARCDSGQGGIANAAQCYAQKCEPFFAQCMQNAAADIGQGPAPDTKTVTVIQTVDLFDNEELNGDPIGSLEEGTKGVVLLKPCKNNRCNVKWPGNEGWVYSSDEPDDFKSLDIP